MHRRVRRTGVLAGALVVSCGGEPALTLPETPPVEERPVAGLVVSEALPGPGAPASGGEPGPRLSFVSLAPGSLPNGVRARVRNSTADGPFSEPIPMIDGGFDPIPVAAGAGDRLELEVEVAEGQAIVVHLTVPERRPPVVVRTTPPRGRTDVALNIRPVIVFSEPIQPGSVSPASLRLLNGGSGVTAEVGLRSAEPWVADLVPTAPLEPGREYVLEVTRDIRDLQGDPLEETVTVPFVTAFAPLSDLGGRIAFVSDRSGSPGIYLAKADGTEVRFLTKGEAPSWSSDGTRIVFHRGPTESSPAGIHLIDADGAGERRIATGVQPAWSPAGDQIAFQNPVGVEPDGLFVLDLDGSAPLRRLIGYEFGLPDGGYGFGFVGLAAWSPDGRELAFVRGNYGIPWQTYTMSLDGLSPRLLIDQLTTLEPSWSPEGSRVAVVTWVPDPIDGWSMAVASLAADGSGDLVVHHRPTSRYAGQPAWSPDGRHIAFDRFASAETSQDFPLGTRQRLFVVTLETGVVRQLVPDAEDPVLEEYRDYDVAWTSGAPVPP